MFRPATSLRTPSKTFFAELFAAPGPLTIGQTGDNSYPVLFGRVWVLEVRADGELLLHQRQADGTYERVVDDLPPVFDAGAPAGSRRWSLAFDQAARVVVAYEDGEGVVRVTRWDPSANQYVQNVTFAGVDPCVVMDASWSYAIPGSDVLLFYLSPDRERVLCRVQRDVYAVEHLVWDYGQPVILDRVLALPYRYQVLTSDADGAPLPSVLVSDLYPVPTFVRLAGDGVVQSGTYDQVAEALTHALAVSGDGVVHSGLYEAPFSGVRHDLTLDGDGVVASGRYRNVVTTYEPTIALDGDGVIHSGDYPQTATALVHPVTVEGDGQIVGGSYVIP